MVFVLYKWFGSIRFGFKAKKPNRTEPKPAVPLARAFFVNVGLVVPLLAQSFFVNRPEFRTRSRNVFYIFQVKDSTKSRIGELVSYLLRFLVLEHF